MSKAEEINCLKSVYEAFVLGIGPAVDFDNTNGNIRKALQSYWPNSNPNDFPDFFFEGGAIEHFLIGTSKETRKGSAFKAAQREEKNAAAVFSEQQKAAFLSSTPLPGSFGTSCFQTKYEGFSYGEFLRSLERNIGNHIHSLRKNQKEYGDVIFVLEQQTPRLCIYEEGSFAHFYLMSEDRNALAILSKYAENVQYVIYFSGDSVEAIDLKRISEMMPKSKENLDVRGGRLIESHLTIYIDF